MSYEFRLPDIGEGVAEGEVVQWFVHEGDAIREDDPLVSVLTDKANVEIPSPRGGRIAKIHAQVGEKVKVGGLLVTIAEGPTGSPAAPAAPSAEAPARPSMAPSPGTPELAPPVPPTPSREGRPALASPYLRRVAAERGIDIDRIRGSGPGGRIIEADLAAPPPVREAPPPAPSPAAVSPAKRAPGATPAVPVPAPGDVERVPIRGLRRVISEHMSESIHRAAHYTYVEEVDVTELMRLRDRMAKHVEKSGTRLSYLPFVIKAVIAGLRAHPWMNATMDDEHSELVVHKSYHIGIATATPDGLIVPVIHRAETKSLAGLAQEIQELSE
ncbi:MAG TPA: dihydrolipoamide acetyltransferase family protein, partial [Thermoplasmata archaeon]|nr:dihydrolipoamide acetyltransferase family protein [Thermoplasmata archaeon]